MIRLCLKYIYNLPRVVGVLFGLFLYSPENLAQTVVTTYITKVQEERQDTRWTLTEWLRIKERMRMMDLWLALFSDPKKGNTFRPELSLSYFKNQSVLSHSPLDVYQGVQARGQVWLTNLVSSTVGVRMLNLDLGGEFQRDEHTMALPDSQLRSSRLQSFMGSLRLFGKHIQDSSLIIKYGEFKYQGFDPTMATPTRALSQRGPLYGAELSLYMSSWFGVEGQYSLLGQEPNRADVGALQGNYSEALAFIEISVLRLMAGSSVREWSQVSETGTERVKQPGLLGGLKLNL